MAPPSWFLGGVLLFCRSAAISLAEKGASRVKGEANQMIVHHPEQVDWEALDEIEFRCWRFAVKILYYDARRISRTGQNGDRVGWNFFKSNQGWGNRRRNFSAWFEETERKWITEPQHAEIIDRRLIVFAKGLFFCPVFPALDTKMPYRIKGGQVQFRENCTLTAKQLAEILSQIQ